MGVKTLKDSQRKKLILYRKRKMEQIMIGYPFFYGNEDLIQKDFYKDDMIFYLDPITENLELNLTQAASLPILVETINLPLGDEFTHQFCDQISQHCGTFRIMPDTKTFVIDFDGFCKVVSENNVIINKVASNLVIPQESAIQQAQNFFRDKTVIVQAEGLQGSLYKVGLWFQSAGSAGLVTQTISLAKLAGVSGLQILKAQPYLAIALPTTGAMFFYGCGAIVGNNTFGKALITTGDLLALPMKGFEIMWNSYGNPLIQNVLGIPVILNMTQTFKTGPGYTIDEVVKYISFNKPSIFKTLKKKLINWLSKP